MKHLITLHTYFNWVISRSRRFQRNDIYQSLLYVSYWNNSQLPQKNQMFKVHKRIPLFTIFQHYLSACCIKEFLLKEVHILSLLYTKDPLLSSLKWYVVIFSPFCTSEVHVNSILLPCWTLYAARFAVQCETQLGKHLLQPCRRSPGCIFSVCKTGLLSFLPCH